MNDKEYAITIRQIRAVRYFCYDMMSDAGLAVDPNKFLQSNTHFLAPIKNPVIYFMPLTLFWYNLADLHNLFMGNPIQISKSYLQRAIFNVLKHYNYTDQLPDLFKLYTASNTFINPNRITVQVKGKFQTRVNPEIKEDSNDEKIEESSTEWFQRIMRG